jgi:hypothetical protein
MPESLAAAPAPAIFPDGVPTSVNASCAAGVAPTVVRARPWWPASWKVDMPMSRRRHEPSAVAVHEFVQLLAGRVPDEELATVRLTLARGQAAPAAAAALAMVAEHDVPLLAGDIETARSLAREPGALDGVQPAAEYPRLPFEFSILGPDEALEADDLDKVMAQAAQARSERVAGVWRTWRYPLADRGGPETGNEVVRRIYLVQVADGAAAPALAGGLQAALDGHGDAAVEVIAAAAPAPPYQAAAQEDSALVWSARGGAPGPEEGLLPWIEALFDLAKPDTERGFRIRADGEWIWTNTVPYCPEQHGVAYAEELATDINARFYTPCDD